MWSGIRDVNAVLPKILEFCDVLYGQDGPGSSVGIATGYGLDGPGIECGPGSVVGIATGYGLDGPGIETRWGARFSAPVQTGPGAHPAPCTMGTGSFPGVKSGRRLTQTPHPLLVPWSWKGSAIPLLPLWAVRPVQSLSACTRVHFTFFFIWARLYISLALPEYSTAFLSPKITSSLLTESSYALLVFHIFDSVERYAQRYLLCNGVYLPVSSRRFSDPNSFSMPRNRARLSCP